MTTHLNTLFNALISARLALLNAQIALERAKSAWECADALALLCNKPPPEQETSALDNARFNAMKAQARYEIALLAYTHEKFLVSREDK
jgi:hypothetical protein